MKFRSRGGFIAMMVAVAVMFVCALTPPLSAAPLQDGFDGDPFSSPTSPEITIHQALHGPDTVKFEYLGAISDARAFVAAAMVVLGPDPYVLPSSVLQDQVVSPGVDSVTATFADRYFKLDDSERVIDLDRLGALMARSGVEDYTFTVCHQSNNVRRSSGLYADAVSGSCASWFLFSSGSPAGVLHIASRLDPDYFVTTARLVAAVSVGAALLLAALAFLLRRKRPALAGVNLVLPVLLTSVASTVLSVAMFLTWFGFDALRDFVMVHDLDGGQWFVLVVAFSLLFALPFLAPALVMVQAAARPIRAQEQRPAGFGGMPNWLASEASPSTGDRFPTPSWGESLPHSPNPGDVGRGPDTWNAPS